VDGPLRWRKQWSCKQFPTRRWSWKPIFLIASAIEAPLLSAGYRVVIATNLAEALALLSAGPIHIAVIDFRLQYAEPDGLVAALKRDDIPFIFSTAASVEEVCEHFPSARVMEKPFTDDNLLSAVASLVSAEGGHSKA